MAGNQVNLQWQFDAAVKGPVAVVPVDFGAFSPWYINLATTAFDGQPLSANWITIDNYNNSVKVTFAVGPITLDVAPFTRKTFQLPGGVTGSVLLTGTVGAINIIFWSQLDQPPDDANLLSIQQTAQGGVTYPFAPTITVTTALNLANHQNKQLLFVPTVANIAFNLLAISTPVPNALICFKLWNNGTKTVSVTPAGADVINGIFTSVAPLILSPGDYVDLSCDGTTWYAHGKVSFESAEQTLAIAGTVTIAHGLGVKPEIEVWLRNKTAELNFNVGDEVLMATTMLQTITGTTNQEIVTGDATNIFLRQDSAGATRVIGNKTTGVQAVVTAGNWRYFFRAKAWI